MTKRNAVLTEARKEELFRQILSLYDLADNVVNAVGLDGIKNRSKQLELAVPFVKQVTESADVMANIYTEVVNKSVSVTPEMQNQFEAAFQKIFYAYRDFLDGVDEKLLPEVNIQ